MRKSKKIPLVSGLIGSKSRSIHGQLEASYINYNTVKIELKRKPYTGLSDVKFSISDTDLADIVQILNEANQKIEAYWLTKISPKRRELKAKKAK
jgi:SPX domain protein involved in polyphosphate accumulation